MKPASPALIALINSVIAGTGQMHDFDLYTITTQSGQVIRFSTADFNINCGGGTNYNTALQYPSGNYPSNSVKVDQKSSKTQAHWKVGLDADQWVVVVMPRPIDLVTGALFPDQIGNVPWIQAAQSGALDAADVQIDRAYFSSLPTWPITPGGAVPVGTLTIFAGYLAEVDTTNTTATLTINDYRALTSYSMPRHYLQAGCRHALYDAGCNANGNMNRASFAVPNINCTAGTTQNSIVATGIPTPGGSKTYTLGQIMFTSGLNVGLWGFVVKWDGQSTLSLLHPMPFTIAVGDQFTAYPGCDKTQAACALFNNTPQFGGEPFIPEPEVLITGGA